MTKYQNVSVKISNYATSALNETLQDFGEMGFKFVNSAIAKNEHGIDVMYCFFTREKVNEGSK